METAHGWSEPEINDALASTSNREPKCDVRHGLASNNGFLPTGDVAIKYDGDESSSTNLGLVAQKGYYYAKPLTGLDEMFGEEAIALDPALMEM